MEVFLFESLLLNLKFIKNTILSWGKRIGIKNVHVLVDPPKIHDRALIEIVLI